VGAPDVKASSRVLPLKTLATSIRKKYPFKLSFLEKEKKFTRLHRGLPYGIPSLAGESTGGEGELDERSPPKPLTAGP
jgi:hypothetical protein